jgi:hypothetical protein
VTLVLAAAVIASGFAMAQRSIDEQRREHFDRYYPFVEWDEGLRDHWKPGQKWTGLTGWSTRHGKSIARGSVMGPFYMSEVSLADGTRVDVHNVGKKWRYRISDTPRRWVHGSVDIRPDGVTFTAGEQPKYNPPAASEHPDLEADLAGDIALRERLLDADFADTLYVFLKNGDFFKEGGERIWSIGLSRAAGLVADLRGQGDVYTDYYPHGGRAPLTDDVRNARRKLGMPELTQEELASEAVLTARFEEIKTFLIGLGWRRTTKEDEIVAADAIRRELASWEARPGGAIPNWSSGIRVPGPSPGEIRLGASPDQTAAAGRPRLHDGTDRAVEKRLHSLAISGRISEAEYRSMVARIAHTP